MFDGLILEFPFLEDGLKQKAHIVNNVNFASGIVKLQQDKGRSLTGNEMIPLTPLRVNVAEAEIDVPEADKATLGYAAAPIRVNERRESVKYLFLEKKH